MPILSEGKHGQKRDAPLRGRRANVKDVGDVIQSSYVKHDNIKGARTEQAINLPQRERPLLAWTTSHEQVSASIPL